MARLMIPGVCLLSWVLSNQANHQRIRTCTRIFTHISVHILPSLVTRRDRAAVLDLDCGRPPRTCHDDQWLSGALGVNLVAKIWRPHVALWR